MGVAKISDIRATGMSILVELINPEEMIQTTIITPEGGAKDLIDGASQAYILSLGPKVDPEEWGFDEGDRVRLQPANPTMGPIYINDPSTVQIQGRVVMVVRQVEMQ